MSATRCQCGLPKKAGYIVCLVCWRAVPIALKRRVWAVVRALRLSRGEPRKKLEHRAAVRAVFEHPQEDGYGGQIMLAVKKEAFLVLRAGKLCRLYNAAATVRGGVLIPGTPAKLFARRRDARRAINRTKRVATLLKGSLIEAHKPVRELLEILDHDELFTITPVAK